MKFRTANEFDLYHEVHGEGEPLVLLHGGVHGIVGIQPLVEAMARRRRVIAVELEAHGRSGAAGRPLSWDAMAADVVDLLRSLGLDAADWMGYSLGGGVALRAALHRPEAVRRLVLVSTPFARQGWFPEVLEGMAGMGPHTGEMMKHSPLAQAYPDADWGALFGKLHDLLATEYDLSGELSGLRATTLLVYADADAIKPAHMTEFFARLGGGLHDAGVDGSQRPASRLAVIPGHTHYDVGLSPTLPELAEAFLAAG